MALPLVTAGVALFYLGAVPLKLAFWLRIGSEGSGFRFAVAPFEARFARRIVVKRRDGRRKPSRLLRRLNPLAAAKAAFRAAKFLVRRVRVDEIELDGRFGAEDAALTALLCGGVSALGNGLRCATGRPIRLSLSPDFSGGSLHGELTGMISVRLGHIIAAALLGAYQYVTGRFTTPWTSTPLKAS